MARKPPLVDFSKFDLDKPIATIEDIRKLIPQRFEMEQLTAVCYEDIETHSIVGYKDLTPDEFWCRGHMPGMPLMPGVIMCEAAAQLATYHSQKNKLMEGTIGFGGLENVRFRGMVRPGDRFVVMVRLLKVRRVIMTCAFQCYVEEEPVAEGLLKGVALPVDIPQNPSS